MGKKSRKNLKICLKNEFKRDGRERSRREGVTSYGLKCACGKRSLPVRRGVECGGGAVRWRGVWWLEGEFLWREIYLKNRFEEVR